MTPCANPSTPRVRLSKGSSFPAPRWWITWIWNSRERLPMMNRNYLASLILALWFSSAQAASGPFASLVRAFRESPTSARRAAVTNYAASHPKDAPLAALALGITAYEQHDYASTIALLQPIPQQVPALADYAAYYLAAAPVEAGDPAPLGALIAPTHRDSLASPF